jgi:hypothetical protein
MSPRRRTFSVKAQEVNWVPWSEWINDRRDVERGVATLRGEDAPPSPGEAALPESAAGSRRGGDGVVADAVRLGVGDALEVDPCGGECLFDGDAANTERRGVDGGRRARHVGAHPADDKLVDGTLPEI